MRTVQKLTKILSLWKWTQRERWIHTIGQYSNLFSFFFQNHYGTIDGGHCKYDPHRLSLLRPNYTLCVNECGHHWFRQWLETCSVPTVHQNQCWRIVNWTLRNKTQCSFNKNTIIFIIENVIENIICENVGGDGISRLCKVSTMPADAQASKVVRASASMILTV